MKRYGKFLLIWIFVIAISVSAIGCSTDQIIATATETPTLTSSPSSTATLSATPSATACPTQINALSPNLVSLSPVLVVVLFDSEQTPFDPLDLINNVMSKAAEPGDALAMFRSGYRWHQFDLSKVVVHDSPKLNVPDIILSPTSINSLTPQPTSTLRSSATPQNTPDVSEVDIFSRSQTQTAFPDHATQTVEVYESQIKMTEIAAESTEAAIMATATEIAALNHCAELVWNEEFAEIDANWQDQKATHRADFLTQIAGTIVPSDKSTQTDSLPTPTPYTQAEVFDGLTSASLVFSNLCNEEDFNRCILIILDNLHDWRHDAAREDLIAEFEIKLDNVEVISILANCSETYSPSKLCGPAQDLWTPQFISYGASSVQYHNNRDLTNFLIEEINKDR